jgi:hypothetical protein
MIPGVYGFDVYCLEVFYYESILLHECDRNSWLKIQHEGKAETTIEHHCRSSIDVMLFINNEASIGDIIRWADMAIPK